MGQNKKIGVKPPMNAPMSMEPSMIKNASTQGRPRQIFLVRKKRPQYSVKLFSMRQLIAVSRKRT